MVITKTLWALLAISSCSITLCLAIDVTEHLHHHTPQIDVQTWTPPPPSAKAIECLTEMRDKLIVCRNQSIQMWNVHDYSPLGDVCCAQFDLLECDLDYVAKSKCTSEELDEVNDYFEDLFDFYNQKTCHPFPRGSTHCSLPILSKVTHERPPRPDPLVIDCLGNIRPEVRLGCWREATLKWNISRKRTPVRNLCCAAWDDIDCLDQVAKIRCPSQEADRTDEYFKEVEDWATQLTCKNAAYHSANCTIKGIFDAHPTKNVKVTAEEDSYVPYVFPAKAEKSGEQPISEVDEDYRDFLMNYILTVFPHLLNLLVLLTVVLVAVIVIQCFLIGRQLKREQCFSTSTYNGYQKMAPCQTV